MPFQSANILQRGPCLTCTNVHVKRAKESQKCCTCADITFNWPSAKLRRNQWVDHIIYCKLCWPRGENDYHKKSNEKRRSMSHLKLIFSKPPCSPFTILSKKGHMGEANIPIRTPMSQQVRTTPRKKLVTHV